MLRRCPVLRRPFLLNSNLAKKLETSALGFCWHQASSRLTDTLLPSPRTVRGKAAVPAAHRKLPRWLAPDEGMAGPATARNLSTACFLSCWRHLPGASQSASGDRAGHGSFNPAIPVPRPFLSSHTGMCAHSQGPPAVLSVRAKLAATRTAPDRAEQTHTVGCPAARGLGAAPWVLTSSVREMRRGTGQVENGTQAYPVVGKGWVPTVPEHTWAVLAGVQQAGRVTAAGGAAGEGGGVGLPRH